AMILSTSPRKTVPLASGDDWKPGTSSRSSSVTKRIFFCGVVVENEGNAELSEDVRELVASFGDPLGFPDDDDMPSSVAERPGTNDNRTRRRAMTNTSAIQDVINELVNTERSYVKRLQILKQDYADPLRTYARSKQTAIIPAYEANTLFGNIDTLLPVNEAFLEDLERMVASDRPDSIVNIGDVVLKHFKQQSGRGFELYKHFYVKREEAQAIFEREMAKKGSFATFIDRIKYSSGDSKNRIGLRELLAEPVQRIPRYTLMFRTMIKRMAPSDPQRARLVEADAIASKIALAETDEPTKRASVMHCLTQTIEDFPPGLISHSRRLIDYVDVDDAHDGLNGPGSSGALEPLRCTLFLFDDKLMIVKRPSEKTARTLTGLDRLEKATKSGSLPSGLKKNGLSCRGVVDLFDVVATEVGDADFHLFLENPPLDQPERWNGRPFRSMSVVHPPSLSSFNPQKNALDKKRFLENLWKAQVDLRARSGTSVTLQAEEKEVESRGGRVTIARTYFHVFQRTSFLKEAKKTKVVVQIDPSGAADPLPFGIEGPPYVVIRVQPIEGDLARYKVTSSDPGDDNEEDIVQAGRVPERIIQTIHQYGLFKFRTDKNSVPSTPTASSRSRAAIFGLDVIGRQLFGPLAGSSKTDFSSISSSRRSKSTTRSSVYTQSSDGSLMRFSQRSQLTGSTSVTSVEDESFASNKSSGRSRKLLKKRSKSPIASGTESGRWSRPQSRAGSVSRESSPAPPADEGEEVLLQRGQYVDESEWDLAQRLELARRNSKNQHGNERPLSNFWDGQFEDTIYEEMPPQQVLRPASRASTATATATAVYSQHSTTPQTPVRPTTPSSQLGSPIRSPSRNSERPRGPRSPSPLPLPPGHSSSPPPSPLPPMENVELAIEAEIRRMRSPVPGGRYAFEAAPVTPQTKVAGGRPTEPLSIKKRESVDEGAGPRKVYAKTSPLVKGRVVSPRRVSPVVRQARTKLPAVETDEEKVLAKSGAAKDGLESSRRAVKRIKLDAERLRSCLSTDSGLRTTRGAPRTPQHVRAATTTPVQERLEEMRQLIGRRHGELGTPTRSGARPFGAAPLTPSSSSSSVSGADAEELAKLIADAASEADRHLLRASAAQEELGVDLALLAADLKEKAGLLEKARVELQSQKRQCELVKSLLDNAVAENGLVYDTVNEELGELFNSAQLPETEAWAAMAADVRKTKAARNELAMENSRLKRRLAEVESERDAWSSLLRKHGLLS
ncbi:hypothetical protein K488DRAFT_42843, partial [Vararia minispora EC-137]